MNVSRRTFRIGIVHHVHHSLLHCKIHLHGGGSIEVHLFAYQIHKVRELRHLADIVGQCDFLLKAQVLVGPDVADGQHGQVIALFRFTSEVLHSLHHTFRDVLRIRSERHRINHPFLSKQLMLHVFSLSESIGVEENRGARSDVRLLQRELPSAHDADGEVAVTREERLLLHILRLVEQERSVMSGIAVAQPSCR